MIKLILILFIVFIGISTNAQEIESRIDLRFGTGTSFFSSTGRFALMFENEVNMKLNRYFSVSAELAFGKRDFGINDDASFITIFSFTQLNTNFYLSPFKNNRRNDFRIGTGLTRFWMTDVEQYAHTYGSQGFSSYRIYKYSSRGFNIIIENTFLVTEKFLIGVKLFTQLYEVDLNTGILLKLGAKI